MRRIGVVLLVTFVVSVCPLAAAVGLVKNHVSGEANWVVHGDVEKFNESGIGELVRKELSDRGVDQQLEFFKSIFSFHPLDDIKGITLYGKGQDKARAVVLVRGNFKKELLANLVRQNPYYEEQKYGDYVVHSWIDENKNDKGAERQYGSFHGKDMVLIGSSVESIANGLDVLDGKKENARQTGLFKALRRPGKGVFIVAAANGVGKMAEQWEQAMMLKHTEQSCLTVGEVEGNLNIDLTLQATSSKTAEELTQLIQGLVAFLNLAGQEQPQVAELASAIKLTTKRNTVRVHFEYDVDKIAKFIKAEWKKKQAQEAEKAKAAEHAAKSQDAAGK